MDHPNRRHIEWSLRTPWLRAKCIQHFSSGAHHSTKTCQPLPIRSLTCWKNKKKNVERLWAEAGVFQSVLKAKSISNRYTGRFALLFDLKKTASDCWVKVTHHGLPHSQSNFAAGSSEQDPVLDLSQTIHTSTHSQTMTLLYCIWAPTSPKGGTGLMDLYVLGW